MVKQTSMGNAQCLDTSLNGLNDSCRGTRRSTRSRLNERNMNSVSRRSNRSRSRPKMFSDFSYDNDAQVSPNQRRAVSKNTGSLKKAATTESQVKNKRVTRKSLHACIICNHSFKTVNELSEHREKLHQGTLFKCTVCSLVYVTYKKL